MPDGDQLRLILSHPLNDTEPGDVPGLAKSLEALTIGESTQLRPEGEEHGVWIPDRGRLS